MTREEIKELIQQTKAESLNEKVVKGSDLETAQKQSYAKGWNACNGRWIQTLKEHLSKLQIGTCEDAIIRQQAIDKMQELEDEDDEMYGCSIPEGFDGKRAIEALKTLPSIQPKPKTGHWVPDVDRWGDVVTTVNGYRCSECGKFNADNDNFCPNCGAKMR